MEITVDRRRLGWLWLVYAALWGPLRLLYLAANRAYGTDSPAGDLSSIWWILVLSWFLADLLLVLGFTFLYRTLRVGATNRNRRFWFAVSEIVPLWLLLHLSLLLFEYPISTRLESVGLGKLEVIVFAVTMVAGAAYLLRSIKSGEDPIGRSANGRLSTATICFICILGLAVLLAIPYFATRPLPSSELIHAAQRR
jgi:hypothetical protein